MSFAAKEPFETAELVDDIGSWLRTYYKDELGEFIDKFPKEQQHVVIDYQDVTKRSELARLAEALLYEHDEACELIAEAVAQYDFPVDKTVEPEDVTIRVSNTPPTHTAPPSELRSDHGSEYVCIEGTLSRVGAPQEVPESLVFDCQRCPSSTEVPQLEDGLTEPHECPGCERQGPFLVNESESVFRDFAMIEVEDRDAAHMGSASVHGEVWDRLLEVGGEFGLWGRAGDDVRVYGVVRRRQKAQQGKQARLWNRYIDVRHVEFVQDAGIDNDIDKEEFERHAKSGEAVTRLVESIAPQLKGGERLDQIRKGLIAYLFGAPRKEMDGATYRGDIHALLIGDPATGKSTFIREAKRLSPRFQSVSGTEASGVGLTAAATQSDFDGQWSLSPGVLPKANGGHAIIDEIDKTSGDAPRKLHDAMEGDQQIKISKAGIQATMNTRSAVLAGGNPTDGRINRYENFADQIDIDPALLSRFDLVYLMMDVADETADKQKAEHVIHAMSEAGRDDANSGEGGTVNREVEADVIKAWIAYAREHVDPRITDEKVIERLSEWYTAERAESPEDGVALTLRSLEAGVRLAEAFARVRLSEQVSVADAEFAIEQSKRVMGDIHFDPESGTFDADRAEGSKTPVTQKDRINKIAKAIRSIDECTIEDVIEETGLESEAVEHEVEKMRRQGDVYEPQSGVLSYVD